MKIKQVESITDIQKEQRDRYRQRLQHFHMEGNYKKVTEVTEDLAKLDLHIKRIVNVVV